jgi:hypothetical protein
MAFRVTVRRTGVALGDFEARNEEDALQQLACKMGFGDFDDLAQSMEMTAEKAAGELLIRSVENSAGFARAAAAPARRTRKIKRMGI